MPKQGYRWLRYSASLLVLVLAAVSCGPGAAATPTAPGSPTNPSPTATVASPAALQKINVLMGFTFAIGQYYSMFLVGVQRGTYAKWGLDPNFIEGSGSITTDQVVGNGGADFGLAVDPGATVSAVVAGAPIEFIGQTIPSTPVAVLSKAPNKIVKPQDLVGKRIGVPPGSAQAQFFTAFLNVTGIDPKSFEIVGVPASAVQTSLIAGQIDGFVSYAHTNLPALRARGVEPYAMLFSDFGLTLQPGEGVVVSKATIAKNPDLVRHFMCAVDESVRYAIAHPDEASKAGPALYPQAMTETVTSQQLAFELPAISNGQVPGQGILYTPIDKGDALIATLAKYAGLKGAGAASEYMTNQFVPPAGGCTQ